MTASRLIIVDYSELLAEDAKVVILASEPGCAYYCKDAEQTELASNAVKVTFPSDRHLAALVRSGYIFDYVASVVYCNWLRLHGKLRRESILSATGGKVDIKNWEKFLNEYSEYNHSGAYSRAKSQEGS